MNTHETKARAVYDAALADADQWRQTIAKLEVDMAAAEAETPTSPGELANIADRQVSLSKQLEMARTQLSVREAAVLDAGRAIVAAEADDLQPALDEAQKQISEIDQKTAELRAAVSAHVDATRSAREAAGAQLRQVQRLQEGLRAAVAGDGVREYFRTLDELPASLHPQTGILPQRSFQRDIDDLEFRREQERRQDALSALAGKLKIEDGLAIALTDYERPSGAWLDRTRSAVASAGSEKDTRALLAAFDEAVQLDADVSSLGRLATHLTDPEKARSYGKALSAHFARIRQQAAELLGA